jgi:hypothetical protein
MSHLSTEDLRAIIRLIDEKLKRIDQKLKYRRCMPEITTNYLVGRKARWIVLRNHFQAKLGAS